MDMKRIICTLLTICLLLPSFIACQNTSDTNGNENPTNNITEPTTQDPPHTHNWEKATCTTPKTCADCGETKGEPLGHIYIDGLCSRCGENNESTLNGCYDGSKVTITFAHNFSTYTQAILNDAIADFNMLYPNITIEHTSYGDYDSVRDQIANELAVGAQHNIAICYPDHVSLFLLANGVVNLDDMINNTQSVTRADGSEEVLGLTNAQIVDFIPGFYAEGSCYGNGNTYSLPLAKSTEVLYYNKTFFTEHNLSVPTTWEEMWALCEEIKKIDPNSCPLAYDNEANWFITMAEQLNAGYTDASKQGSDRFAFNNTQMKDFAKELRSYYEKGYFTTMNLCGGSYTSNLFINKACYMSISTSAGASYYSSSFDVGVATLPQVDKSSPKSISQGPSMCILKSGDEQEDYASWLFMEYLCTNVTFQAQYSMLHGYMPVIQSVYNHPVYSEFLNNTDNLVAEAIKTAFSQKEAYFTSDAFIGSSVARSEVGFLLQKCLAGMYGSNQTLDQFIDKCFADAISECVYQSGY